MITAIWGAIALVIALVGGAAGHWLGTRKTAAAVADAKTQTETTTRITIANESAIAAGQAQAEGAAIRTAAVTQASTTASGGRDALIDEMRKDGEIQP